MASTERFSTKDFENALSIALGAGNWQGRGLQDGEYTFVTKLRSDLRLKIRSSIDRTGRAASTGENSIRIWIEQKAPGDKGWTYTQKAADCWTQRTPGWQGRMAAKLALASAKAGTIKHALRPGERAYFVTNGGPNHGRPFGKINNDYKTFRWLDV